jgi:hypothetical protein
MDQKMSAKDEIQKKLDALPAEIKNLLYSNEVDVIVQQVGAKNKLHLDQTGLLLTEINEVMTGDLAVEDFAKEIMSVFQMDEQKAAAITQDVDTMLFSKVRDAMKKAYEAAQSPVPVASDKPLAAILPVSKPPVVIPTAPKAPLASVLPASGGAPTRPIPAPAAPMTPATPPIASSAPQAAPMTTIPVVKPTSPAPDMHAADVMLTEKTVEVAPPKPIYKKDPYREPAE